MRNDTEFWNMLDRMVEECSVVIDRPKGSVHPKYPNLKYELDYGYLEGTASMDGGGIDIWRGSNAGQGADAVICILDYCKKDSEIKILYQCTDEEKEKICRFHNQTETMKGIMIRRENYEA